MLKTIIPYLYFDQPERLNSNGIGLMPIDLNFIGRRTTAHASRSNEL